MLLPQVKGCPAAFCVVKPSPNVAFVCIYGLAVPKLVALACIFSWPLARLADANPLTLPHTSGFDFESVETAAAGFAPVFRVCVWSMPTTVPGIGWAPSGLTLKFNPWLNGIVCASPSVAPRTAKMLASAMPATRSAEWRAPLRSKARIAFWHVITFSRWSMVAVPFLVDVCSCSKNSSFQIDLERSAPKRSIVAWQAPIETQLAIRIPAP